MLGALIPVESIHKVIFTSCWVELIYRVLICPPASCVAFTVVAMKTDTKIKIHCFMWGLFCWCKTMLSFKELDKK